MKTHPASLEERLIDRSSGEPPDASPMAASAAPLPLQPLQQQQQQQEQQQQQQQQQQPLRRVPSRSERLFLRFLLIAKVTLAVVAALLLLLVLTHIQATAQFITELVSGVQHLGRGAPFAFIGLYIIFIACLLPAEFMHLAAGFIFSRIYGEGLGIAVAFLCSLCGALLSGLICFLISRYLLFDSLHARMASSTLFRAFDAAVEEGGLTFVALIRLSPILPYSLTSYLFGVTALKTSHLLLGTFSGTPLILAFNFIGSALSDLKDLDIRAFSWTWQRICLVALGVLMATASMVYITRLTRRKLEAAYAAALRERNAHVQMMLASAPGNAV